MIFSLCFIQSRDVDSMLYINITSVFLFCCRIFLNAANRTLIMLVYANIYLGYILRLLLCDKVGLFVKGK